MNGGRFEGMICTCRDITRKVHAEQELRLKSSALENSITGFYVADTEGHFVYVNPAFLNMWGYREREEVLGTSVVGYCQSPETPQQIMQDLRKEGQCTSEFTAKRRDGGTFEVFMASYLHRDDEQGELYVGSVIDISERKQTERLLARHHEELEKAVQQRTGELRTMVNSMVGREIRMSELKEDIRALRGQLKDHGFTPVADDPLGKD
jgi:PAS domain S-box-containing protein